MTTALRQATTLAVLLALSVQLPATAGAGQDDGERLARSKAVASALQAGADRAASCQTQVEDDADELPGCVQARARAPAGTPTRLAEAQRLGALFRGWVIADIAAAYAVAGAEPVAATLLGELRPLQRQLSVGDAALCALLRDGCHGIFERLREVERASAAKQPPTKAPR